MTNQKVRADSVSNSHIRWLSFIISQISNVHVRPVLMTCMVVHFSSHAESKTTTAPLGDLCDCKLTSWQDSLKHIAHFLKHDGQARDSVIMSLFRFRNKEVEAPNV